MSIAQLLLAGGGVPPTNITLSANTADYNLFTAAGSPAGAVTVNLTINSGVKVYSTSTSTAGLDTGTGWHASSVLNITNDGEIWGKPGAGGGSGTAGGAGGKAFNAQRAVNVTNNGSINGGGGGGGGGASAELQAFSSGGKGCDTPGSITNATPGNGGTGAAYNAAAASGGSGTTVSLGSGSATAGNGGNGGAAGTAGAAGTGPSGASDTSCAPSYFYSGGSAGGAGAAGNAITGNSNITWLVNGTKNGPIS